MVAASSRVSRISCNALSVHAQLPTLPKRLVGDVYDPLLIGLAKLVQPAESRRLQRESIVHLHGAKVLHGSATLPAVKMEVTEQHRWAGNIGLEFSKTTCLWHA